MRPIKLKLTNFGVYRGVHEVDFSSLDFFVIRGKVGAGKSTLVDAICYALYGKVPRYGEQLPSRYLISKGEKSMKVYFKFSVRGNMYEVEILYEPMNTDKKHTLRFRENDNDKKDIGSFEKLENYIKNILKLDYETFTKVLLLPQNQFDRLLKPKKVSEKLQILNSLLGYSELISNLKKHISNKKEASRFKLEEVKKRLSLLQGVNSQTINQIEVQIKQLEKDYEDLSREKAEKEELLRKCRERDGVLSEMKTSESQLQNLLSQQENIEQEKRRLEIAQELLPYLPKIDEYERYTRHEEKYTEEKLQKETELIKCSNDRLRIEEEYRKVKNEFERLEEYNREIVKINSILQLLENYKELSIEKENISQKLKGLEDEISQYVDKEKDYIQRLEKEQKHLEEVQKSIRTYEESGIEDKVKQVDKLKEYLKRLEQIASEVELFKKEIEKLQEHLDRTKGDLEDKIEKYTELTQKIEEEERLLDELRAHVSKEGELLLKKQRLKDLSSKADELESIREEKQKALIDKERIEKQLKTLEGELKVLESRRLEIYAAELRMSLKEGDICPVCGGLIKEGYHLEEHEDIQSLLNTLKQLQEKVKSLREELNQVEVRISVHTSKEKELEDYLTGRGKEDIQRELSSVKEELKSLEKNRSLMQEKEAQIKELKRELQKLSDTIQRLKTEEIEYRERLRSKEDLIRTKKTEEEDILKELGQEPENVRKEIENIEKSYEDLRSLREKERKYAERIETLKNELYQSQQRLAELRGIQNNIKQRLDELSSRVEKLSLEIQTQTGEPASESLAVSLRRKMVEISKNIEAVQEKYQRVSEDFQKITNEETKLKSEIQNIERNLSDIKRLKGAIAADLYQLNTRYGNLEEAKKHALTREEVAELQKEVETYEREKHSLEKRLNELKEKLKLFENLPATKEVEEKLKALESSIHRNREDYGNLQKEFENKKRELQEKEELEKRKEQLNEEYEIYEILNKDFWDSEQGFPNYVSKIMLHTIVERANFYFFEFTSGDYTFELDDDLYVLENNTGHKRPVSSLSGGETFLASLSLAFAVADIMSQNAPLESLFIDEGFGSLDAETRESISEFLLERIRNSSDRVIGIITHIDDIADKFKQRIEIEKKGSSAHIKVVHLD